MLLSQIVGLGSIAVYSPKSVRIKNTLLISTTNANILLNAVSSNIYALTSFPSSGTALDVYLGASILKRGLIGFSETRESIDFNSAEINDGVGPQFWLGYGATGSDAYQTGFHTRTTFAASDSTRPLLVFHKEGVVSVGTTTLSSGWNTINGNLNISGVIKGDASVPAYDGVIFYTDTVKRFVLVSYVINSPTDERIHFDFDSNNDGIGDAAGDLRTINGSLNYINSANAKTFIINHPLDTSRFLVHAVIEGPEARVYYRGKATLKNGIATVTLPKYFEALTKKEGRVAFLRSHSFDKVAVKTQGGLAVKDGKLIVYSNNAKSTTSFDWEVVAVRADVRPFPVEPDKKDIEVAGDGPYTYIKRILKKM